MTNTIKFSQFSVANLNDPTTQIVGLASGLNIKTPKVVVWTTATRPTPPSVDGLLGFNTDLEQYEFWSTSLGQWVQLASTVNLLGTFILKTPDATLPNSFALSTLSSGVLKSQTGTGNLSISAPLTSIDSLVTAANEIIYTTGVNVYATSSLSIFSRGLLADIDAATWRTDLGVAGLPVNVSEGGTGKTSFIPFSLIAGGTVSTNPLQSIANVGVLGQVLTSSGPGSLPTWQNSASSGTVSPGVINDLAYYAANGTTVSPIATANNGVLITDNSGVPSISSTIPSAVQGNITSLGTITSGIWNGTAIDVPHGGSGDSSFTAFSVIVGGTTSTGNLQNVVGVGAIGQVLTSQGAGALPSWVNAPGTGTINSGGINQLAYYAAAGTTLSGLATANDGLLVTGNTGIPAILAGPGSSGNILQSNSAAAPSFSTATYPSIATSTGTILRANGSNWIPSSSTFADTYTASNLLYSNGANTVVGLATANNGMLVTSATGVPSILGGPGTTGNVLQSNAAAAPSFSTATYPSVATTTGTILRADGTNWVKTTSTFADTYAINTLLYNASANTVSGLTTAASSILVTSAGGVPSWSTTLPAFTTSSITFSPTTGGIVGTTTNDNAAAGKVGEYISSSVLSPGGGISSGSPTTVTSISLTAGDWEVSGSVYFTPAAGTSVTSEFSAISLVNNAFPTAAASNNVSGMAVTSGIVGLALNSMVGPVRISIASTTTVYLIGFSAFSVSTMTVYGFIGARRVR